MIGTIVPRISLSQSFTLDQLLSLTSKPAMDINVYANARGWKFMELTPSDTSTQAGWKFPSANGQYILLYQKIGNQNQDIIYSVTNQAIFDAIRTRLSAYDLKRVETASCNGGVGICEQYMSKKYEVWLRVYKESSGSHKTIYFFGAQRQTKVLMETMDGRSVWMDPTHLILAPDSMQPKNQNANH